MYKIGVSSMGALVTDDGDKLRMMSENGISAMEISMGLSNYAALDYKKAAREAKEYGIELWSFHLPFEPFEQIDISSSDKEVRTSTLKIQKDLISRAADIGIDKFVIHPSAEPIEDARREEAIKYSMQSLSELADFAAENGAVIAVEDLPRSCLGNCADEILRLISANDKLRVCFDTNHLLKGNNEEFMKKVGEKIITVHVSDYDFVNERHWLPGEGKLDWDMMVDGLEKIGYNGIWMYEISLKTPKTITRTRDLTYTDFVDNANAILNHKKPQFGGTPIPNLGMWA